MAEAEDDMISRLQALLGEEDKEDVYETPYNPTPFSFEPTLAPEEQYFTDSDEYESLTRDAGSKSRGHSNPEPIAAEENSTQEETVKLDEHTNWDEYNLELGMLATDQEESFCPWQTLKKYPYFYIGQANREKVVNKFFDKGKLEQRTWDFFYLHRLDTVNSNPILLVPTSQFEHFLGVINKKLQISLSIPLGNSNGDFYITFENDGTPRPRYLGRSTTPDMASEIRFAAPPKGYLPKGEAPSQIEPTDRSLEAFKAKLEKINRASKGRRNALKDKAKANRIVKQQEWRQAIKRVERYLGLRDISRDRKPEISNRLLSESQDWVAYGEAVKAELGDVPPSAWFDPEMPASFEPEDNVVFVCVDVEAYERDIKKITEIGIATLDMEDIKNVAPGVGGENWFKFIRGRHFRINEYKHLENSEFVQGCADRFEFGESEFISIKDAAAVVATCFRPPYSKPGEAASKDAPKRNLVLVGHDIDADINFLRGIGYDVLNLNLKEKHDTASLYRYLRREQNPRNLGHILGELKIIGWNLHNAGNDAVYTLQAMIGISITHIVERAAKDAELEKKKQLQEKIDEAVKEAKERTLELNEGWSSGGEDSDGGTPVAVEEPDQGQKKLGPRAGSLSQSKGPRNSTSGNMPRENDGSFTWKAEQPPARGRGPHSGRQGGRGYRGRHGNRGSMDTPWRGSGRPKTIPHSTKTSLPNSHQNNKNNGKFNGKTNDKNDDKPSAKEETFDGWW